MANDAEEMKRDEEDAALDLEKSKKTAAVMSPEMFEEMKEY